MPSSSSISASAIALRSLFSSACRSASSALLLPGVKAALSDWDLRTAALQAVTLALHTGVRYTQRRWAENSTEEEEEEQERRFNKLINKGLATVGKKRKVRDDLGATHQTQGRELKSDAEDGAQGSGDDGDNDREPSDDEDRPFVDYDGGYSDDNTARRKKAPAKSKSTKASATKTTKAAASKSTKAAASKSTTKTTKAVASKSTNSAASKSTAKTTPKSTAPKPKPPAKPSTKSKAALKPFVPTEAPPKYIFKNGKHVPNGAVVDEHARRMVEERGKHERQMRELKGGNESGSDEGSDDDDEGEEQVVSTKQGPPAKRRRTTKEPEEQAVKKRKKTVDKRARDDSQDEDEQPVAKKAKLVVELPRPRPAWNSAPNATRGKRVGPPGANNFTYDVDQGGFSDSNLLSIDQRGFKYLIQSEAASFLQPSQVLLNATVTDIAYSSDAVVVTLANGSKISADYAISTFSVGVLQHDDVAFEPTLPLWKQEAIQSMTMATYTKLFLQFAFALYADKVRGRYPVWQSLDLDGFLPGSGIIFATVTVRTSSFSTPLILPDPYTQGDYSETIESLTDAQI
ncbi:flavin-containing amine oxidoreductase-domain containing protein [Roridomyces roridus]|uniref:Flavin-containing amine oxidoreductase-domain containing protein n=1 Tax=Roridomyces roridus TaxID=1738132 RepID=A0AAD7B480_9AGAR|nr:flavin-containing amine oxidoreductase-domain containing protein [Roridomyces roridus]